MLSWGTWSWQSQACCCRCKQYSAHFNNWKCKLVHALQPYAHTLAHVTEESNISRTNHYLSVPTTCQAEAEADAPEAADALYATSCASCQKKCLLPELAPQLDAQVAQMMKPKLAPQLDAQVAQMMRNLQTQYQCMS